VTEMQAWLLLWMMEKPDIPIYVAGHVHLGDYVEVDKVEYLRDPRKGEDLRSLTKKLERMVARGWCTVSRGSFYSITESGKAAITSAAGKRAAAKLVEHAKAKRARDKAEHDKEFGR
jgi:hypothetical protein